MNAIEQFKADKKELEESIKNLILNFEKKYDSSQILNIHIDRRRNSWRDNEEASFVLTTIDL
jgi:hypothetical protein